MLKAAGVLRQRHTQRIKAALEYTWPQGIPDFIVVKDDMGKDPWKAISKWGHPVITEMGFHWEYKIRMCSSGCTR